jgi:hypothetical protein
MPPPTALIAESFLRLLGRRLVHPAEAGSNAEGIEEAIWTAPCVIVAHGTEPDPIFFYGNRRALELFEATWAQFTAMPSRLSAEPLLRDERERLLARVREHGYIDDYSGIRVSLTGRRFRIERAIVWNLIDEQGARHGQAAMFEDWEAVGAAR